MRLKVLEGAIGLVVYEGPSLLDGEPIIAVATGITTQTRNEKTGNLIQVFIFRSDLKPTDAKKQDADKSVCGDCIHRSGSCYVHIGRSVNAVHDAWQRGRYTKLQPKHRSLFRGRKVRFGAYGDPAAVPTRVWARLAGYVDGHTGYSHQWRTCDQDLRRFCMASCDSLDDVYEARKLGWRPFLVRPEGSPKPKGSFHCPAAATSPRPMTCEQCMACGGGEWNGQEAYPTIEVHGSPVALNSYRKYILPQLADTPS